MKKIAIAEDALVVEGHQEFKATKHLTLAIRPHGSTVRWSALTQIDVVLDTLRLAHRVQHAFGSPRSRRLGQPIEIDSEFRHAVQVKWSRLSCHEEMQEKSPSLHSSHSSAASARDGKNPLKTVHQTIAQKYCEAL